jgi:hypothetical protein
MKETPLPLTVLAMMKVGLPLTFHGLGVGVEDLCPKSWPSTVSTCQLKARHLSAMGSSGITSLMCPSICPLL